MFLNASPCIHPCANLQPPLPACNNNKAKRIEKKQGEFSPLCALGFMIDKSKQQKYYNSHTVSFSDLILWLSAVYLRQCILDARQKQSICRYYQWFVSLLYERHINPASLSISRKLLFIFMKSPKFIQLHHFQWHMKTVNFSSPGQLLAIDIALLFEATLSSLMNNKEHQTLMKKTLWVKIIPGVILSPSLEIPWR